MKTSKLLMALTLGALLLTASAAFAGGHGGKHPGKKMAAELGLSADQQRQIEPIMAERRREMQALKNNSGLTSEQRREKARDIHKDSQAKIDQISTPDQRAKRDSMRKEGRGHKGNHKKS